MRAGFVEKLAEMACIPCVQMIAVGDSGQRRAKIQMYRPDETYLLSPEHRMNFKGWDLPKPDLPDFEPEFLVSIGVRKEPHVQMVLDQAKQQRWTLLQVTDYLAVNQEEITENDWDQCKHVVVRDWFNGTSVIYIDSALSPLHFPVADFLPAFDSESVARKRKDVMLKIGFSEWPQLRVLLGLDVSDPRDQDALSEYLLERWEAQYDSDANRHLLAKSGLRFLPVVPLGLQTYSDVRGCFVRPQIFGLMQIHQSVNPSIARLIGVQDHPLLDTMLDQALEYCEAFRSVMASQGHRADVTKLVELLTYFEVRFEEFSEDQLALLKSLPWVFTTQDNLVCAADAHISSEWLSVYYGPHLFEFADEHYAQSDRAVALLRKCGLTDRPTTRQFALALKSHHARVPKSRSRSLVLLLQRFYEEAMAGDDSNSLVALLKSEKMFPCMCGTKLVRCEVEDVCINDNPELADKLAAKVNIVVPQIEDLLRHLGCRYLSDRVQTSYLVGTEQEYTMQAERLRIAIVNRASIILHDMRGITEGMVAAGKLKRLDGLNDGIDLKFMHNLRIASTQTIKQVQRLDDFGCPELPACDAECAFVADYATPEPESLAGGGDDEGWTLEEQSLLKLVRTQALHCY